MQNDDKNVLDRDLTGLSREAIEEREKLLLAIVESPDSLVDEKVRALADLAFLSGTAARSIS